jgi:hypothetical protein
MRAVDLLRAFAPFVGLLVALFVVASHRLIRRLQEAGATSAATAQPVPGRRLTAYWRRRFVAAGVLLSIDGERFWVDDARWQAFRRRRRHRALAVCLTLVALLLTVVVVALSKRAD